MRPMHFLLAIAVASTAFLAGCTQPFADPAGGGEGRGVPPENGAPRSPAGANLTAANVTRDDNGTIEVNRSEGSAAGISADSPLGSIAFGLPSADGGGNFEVKTGASGIVVEVVWNGSDPLRVYAGPPCSDPAGVQCPGAANTNGTNPAKIVITDGALLNQTGSWSYAVYPQANAQGVPFTIFVSVFYGTAPTEAYSALRP